MSERRRVAIPHGWRASRLNPITEDHSMIDLAKDVLVGMLLLPFLLMALVVHMLLEAIPDWLEKMSAPSSTPAHSYLSLVASAERPRI